ncbi:hypothetical protein JCGZ_10596 [Jatropha curcas]|uniref:Uncharacterized protein n=1 Tax=Jatropha curcas TaxID=180498 RepID=A0A067KIB6_JATCU|nr:hypothetical protein JCGZ_10596 [Jatropha curcas]
MTITLMDFAAIIRLPFRGWFFVFDAKLRTVNRWGLRESLRAAFGMEPTIFDKRVRYESIISHYEAMPQDLMAEMDMDVVARAFLFYLLSATLLTNHGNLIVVLLPCHTCIVASIYVSAGEHLKVGYQGATEDIVAARRGSAATDHLAAFVPGAYVVFIWTWLLVHLPPPVEFDPFAKAEELDRGRDDAPVQQQHNKRPRGGFDSRAPDTAVIISKPKHGLGASFSFILDRTGQTA